MSSISCPKPKFFDPAAFLFFMALVAIFSMVLGDTRVKRQYYVPYGGAGSYYAPGAAGYWPGAAGYGYGAAAAYPGYNYGVWG
ncbi:unnamed protein product [Caenorhabditis sp. 36 PRJEB53466]|nr:unnamed protein product [Caenorhabditis sp. 36 PRJEB53466]